VSYLDDIVTQLAYKISTMKVLKSLLVCLVFLSSGACDNRTGKGQAHRAGGDRGPETQNGINTPRDKSTTNCNDTYKVLNLQRFIENATTDKVKVNTRLTFVGIDLEQNTKITPDPKQFAEIKLKFLNDPQKRVFDLSFNSKTNDFFNPAPPEKTRSFHLREVKQDSCEKKNVVAKIFKKDVVYEILNTNGSKHIFLQLKPLQKFTTGSFFDKFELINIYPHSKLSMLLIEGLYLFEGHVAKVYYIVESYGGAEPDFNPINASFWKLLSGLNIELDYGFNLEPKGYGQFDGVGVKQVHLSPTNYADAIKQFMVASDLYRPLEQ